MNNPFSDIIEWLESPEGETWSRRHHRLEHIYHNARSADGYPFYRGIFNVKEDG